MFKRLATVRNAMLPPGSYEHRVYHLPRRERAWFEAWRAECARIIASAHGDAYRSFIDGELHLPTMPPAVSDALGIRGDHNGTTAERYARMLETV